MPAFRALILLLTLAPPLAAENKPPIRALTAFVHLDAAQVEPQIRETLAVLHDAQRAYEQHGYEVQTIRITTQPLPELLKGLPENDASRFLRSLNALAARESFIPNIGLATSAQADQLASILAANDQLESSILVAGNDGIHWPAVTAAAHVVKYLAEHTPNSDGNFRFVATALLGPYGPFFPGSYHDGNGRQFSLGLESAGLVERALAAHPHDIAAAENALATDLARYATESEQIAREVEKRSGWTYAGLDPTPAPAGDVSIGDAIEKFTGSAFGSSGTMTAAAMITRAVKSVPVKQVGYTGLMVPVLEDSRLARRWGEGSFHIDSLLAYSAVCGTGLDTVPLPGDISEDQLARIIGDMASLAFKWNKPLSARLLPVAGKKAGDKTGFHNPRLVDAVLQPLP